MKTFKDLILDELADMYDAEQRIVKALPKMAGAADSIALKELFQSHLKETEGHLEKLEEVFGCFDQKAKGKTCEATKGLLEEGEKIAESFRASPAIDAALISAAQKIEHYEIASYGCLREWTGLLGEKKAAKLLQKILDEEGAANKSLTILARSVSNDNAMGDSKNNASKGRDKPTRGKKSAPQQRSMRTTVGPARRQAEAKAT